MARRHAKLTDEVVAALTPGERVYDLSLRGFFVERGASPKGKPSFRVHAATPSKSGLAQTLMRTVGVAGSGPGELSSKAARTQAQKMLGDIKAGIDPDDRVASGPTKPTLREAWSDYREVMIKRRLSPRSIEANEASFARLTSWHDLPLAAIASNLPGIKRMHDRLSVRKGRKGGPRAANASLSLAATVHTHARESQYPTLPEWPSKAYERNAEAEDTSERGMTPEQLGPWWGEVQKKVKDEQRRQLMLLMLLTGLRWSEAKNLKREHLDGEARTLLIASPKGHRPGVKRRDYAYTLPVTPPMMDCILRARAAWAAGTKRSGPREPSEYLFPSVANGGMPFVESRMKAGVKRGHDLRRSFATACEVSGYLQAEFGPLLLNHHTGSTTSLYVNRAVLLERRRPMLEAVDARIMESIGHA